jgi:cold shock CspA family protein
MNQSEMQMQVNNENTSQNQSEVTENFPNQETQSENVAPASSQTNKESFESRVENSVTEQQVNNDSFTGQVKWFNNRLGYGFITIITQGKRLNEDIFVHQQHINPKTSDYRSLQQGEYVSFRIGTADSDSQVQKNGHPHQAISVTGVYGGSLLCDQIPRRETTSTLSSRSNNRQGHPLSQNSNKPRKFNSRGRRSSENNTDSME